MTPPTHEQVVEAMARRLYSGGDLARERYWDSNGFLLNKEPYRVVARRVLSTLPALGLALVPVVETREIGIALDTAEYDDPATTTTFGWSNAWAAAVAAAPNLLREGG